uniref:Kinesin motor domain-containing protein n=1 Tax=Stomoxys calcitrans TaxID=35570 RepID=A0A1I8NXR1_STOCA
MEIPIQVAVRICPKDLEDEDKKEETINASKEEMKERKCCVRVKPFTGGLPGPPPPGCMDPPDVVQVGPHSFPVTHGLPMGSTQAQIYYQTVIPLMTLFMEGFDASVVAYGQKSCGKTYALYGNGFHENSDENNQGIVARCVAEIFQHIDKHPERKCAVNITWIEIYREIIRDVFGVGSVQCMSKSDAFHWLQVGYKLLNSTKTQMGHSLFSITLEQRWINKDGLIQHRLSTASFTDLGATERVFMLNALGQPSSMPKDLGLQALECVVSTLIDPALMLQGYENVPYHQTLLTTMLKDSFGGRAQTLVIVCVSPWEEDLNETVANMQFAFKVQCVHNFVVINSYSDDNTLATVEENICEALDEDMEDIEEQQLSPPPKNQSDQFALQFAANQWSKLVANAEDLLSKLISSNAIGEQEKQQIESWLIQKQECDDCLNSSDSQQEENSLGPIQEADEPTEDSDPDVSEPETSLPQNSENDSDGGVVLMKNGEKLQTLWQKFELKTNDLIKRNYGDFMENHTKAQEREQMPNDSPPSSLSEARNLGRGPQRGRRGSIQPGSTLSSVEMAMLKHLAAREQFADKEDASDIRPQHEEFLYESGKQSNSALKGMKKKMRKLDASIEGRMKQINEIQETIQLKENIITELIKTSDTRSTAKQKFQKKRTKMQAEYEKSKKALDKALAQRRDRNEVRQLKANVAQLEQRLSDVTSIKHIAGDSEQKVKKLQQSLKESKTLLENLQKKVEKEKSKKEALELQIKSMESKENSNTTNDIREDVIPDTGTIQSQLKHLEEKIDHLQPQGEDLRHEIRNLRNTRDHLLEQRCSLDRKFKSEKSLSPKEERKLLECDEAIEAIDAAIEFKNEMICGHKSIDTSERLQREKGEQMLMARLNKLSSEEMRTLLYKYFTKVIDLRDSSRKLEIQLQQLEREKDAWEWRERVLSNAVRQAYLEGERKTVLLQRQHEMKLTLMLRHLAEESCNSSASFSEHSLSPVSSFYRPPQMALIPTTVSMSSSCYSDSDYEWPHQLKPKLPLMPKPLDKNALMCPLSDRPLKTYQPMDNIKGKEKDTKSKLFAKFQVLTRYASNQRQEDSFTSSSNSSSKSKDKDSYTLTQEDPKKAVPNEKSQKTKVTRQKNKLIIQDKSRSQ